MTTVGAALAEAADTLLRAGIDQARLDARLLAAHALNLTPEQVFGYPEKRLAATELDCIRALTARRCRHEPLALITGEKEFWSLPFCVTPATLIPRPDSETLIEAVLSTYPDRAASLRILDLGTGSGCLLLALLSEFQSATGLGTDQSEAALAIARRNGGTLGFANRATFVCADWNQDLGLLGHFDIVISNPPYIPDGDRTALSADVVEFEPHDALFAGADGLKDYRTLAPLVPALLNEGGHVYFEIGIGQAGDVKDLMTRAGIAPITEQVDLAGIPRCLCGKV